MTKNTGGSILPSSDPQILTPLPFRRGSLVVVPLEHVDTYALVYKDEAGLSVLATHPNGYSCRELALRMASGNAERATKQGAYILACGGTCSCLGGISFLTTKATESRT